MRIDVDTSELQDLAAEYDATPERVFAELEPIVDKGALNIKTRARELVSGAIRGLYLPHYARSIDYDLESRPGEIEAEIGPNPGMAQGGMGPGVEYGSSNTGPTPHLIPAYEEEIPRFEQVTDEALGRSLP